MIKKLINKKSALLLIFLPFFLAPTANAGIPSFDGTNFSQQLLNYVAQLQYYTSSLTNSIAQVKNSKAQLEGATGAARGFAQDPFNLPKFLSNVQNFNGYLSSAKANVEMLKATVGSTFSCKDHFIGAALENCDNTQSLSFMDSETTKNQQDDVKSQLDNVELAKKKLSIAEDEKGMLEAMGNLIALNTNLQIQGNQLAARQSKFEADRITNQQLAMERDTVEREEALKKQRANDKKLNKYYNPPE